MTLLTYKKNCIVLCFFLIGFSVKAQEFSAFFTSQGDSSGFKLLWAPESWPADLKGINVKRKPFGGTVWEKLNESLITPSSNQAEDIIQVTTNRVYATGLRRKYDSLVENNKIPVLTDEEMYDQFLSDPNKIKFLKFLASMEFDFALILGYGFYDVNPPESDGYTYGVFTVDENDQESPEPDYAVDWEYDSEQNIELAVESEVKKIKRRRGLEVIWSVPTNQLADYNIKGFHIYRQDSSGVRERLTETPTRVNMAEEVAPLFHSDPDLDNTKNWAFEAVPVTIFDIEGAPLTANYSAVNIPENLNFDLFLNDENLESPNVDIIWNLISSVDRYVAKYRILRRRDVLTKAVVIDSLKDSSARTYSDSSITESGYYFYKVVFLATSGETYSSNEMMVYKQLVTKPESPQNLRGSVITERGSELIYLTWSEPSSKDDLQGYQLYIDGIMGSGLARDGSVGVLQDPSYKYPVKARYGKAYHFAITALNTENTESEQSTVVEVFVPSKSLPQVNIWPVSKDDNVVTLNWTYQNGIEDLEGFRLYQNGDLIVTEEDLGPQARQWVSNPLESGKYSYELEAVTSFDVTSPASKARNFNISE